MPAMSFEPTSKKPSRYDIEDPMDVILNNKILMRTGFGLAGTLFGATTSSLAMYLLGDIHWPVVIIVAALGFVAAFFGGRKALEFMFKIDDYLQ